MRMARLTYVGTAFFRGHATTTLTYWSPPLGVRSSAQPADGSNAEKVSSSTGRYRYLNVGFVRGRVPLYATAPYLRADVSGGERESRFQLLSHSALSLQRLRERAALSPRNWSGTPRRTNTRAR